MMGSKGRLARGLEEGTGRSWGWRGRARHHRADHGEGRLSTCPLLGVGSTQGDPPPTPKAGQLDQSNLQKSYRESQVTPSQEVRVEPTPKAPSLRLMGQWGGQRGDAGLVPA